MADEVMRLTQKMFFFISAGFNKSGISIGNMALVSVVDINVEPLLSKYSFCVTGLIRLMSNSMMMCKNKKRPENAPAR